MKLHTNSRSHIPMATSLISAGTAIEIGEDYDLLDVNELITKGREGFIAFEVTGESMIDRIHPGNIVFVDTWIEARNGDIVAIEVNGRTSVKFFSSSRRGLYLVPANPMYSKQQLTHKDSCHVLGVVRGHMAIYPR